MTPSLASESMFGVWILDPWNPTSIQPRSSANMKRMCGCEGFDPAFVSWAIKKFKASRDTKENTKPRQEAIFAGVNKKHRRKNFYP